MKETFYISHGSPKIGIDDTLPARGFLKSFQQQVFPEKPNAILIISAHWETADPTVSAAAEGPSETIYDFHNSSEKLYELKYPAPGSPTLARKVQELLSESGFKGVHVDNKRGLDHGAWMPLMLMYPEAEIPVCQLSVQTEKDATHHFEMGKALAPLKDEGVLIIASGTAIHNLRAKDPNAGNSPAPWASEFDSWIKEALYEGRYEDVNEYEAKAPYAKAAHPRTAHIYPLHVAMGAAGENTRGELIHTSWNGGTISYSSYKFTQKS